MLEMTYLYFTDIICDRNFIFTGSCIRIRSRESDNESSGLCIFGDVRALCGRREVRRLVVLVQDLDDERGRAGKGTWHASVDSDDLEGVLVLAVVVQLAEKRDLAGVGVDDEIVVTSFLDSICQLQSSDCDCVTI